MASRLDDEGVALSLLAKRANDAAMAQLDRPRPQESPGQGRREIGRVLPG
jgi:hypothetical protein